MKKCSRKAFTGLFSTVLLFTTLQVAAQSNKTLNRHVSHIIAKVADINGLLNLPDDKQEALADYFARQDSLATAKKKLGKPLEEIAACYKTNRQVLDSILNPQQLGTIKLKDRLTALEPGEEYSPPNGGNRGKLMAKVISYKEQIQLTDQQINKFVNWLMTDSVGEEKELTAILNDAQLTNFSEVAGRRNAEQNAPRIYKLLKSRGYISNVRDTVALQASLLKYQLKRSTAMLKYQITKLPEDLAEMKASEKIKPLILNVLKQKETDKRPALAW